MMRSLNCFARDVLPLGELNVMATSQLLTLVSMMSHPKAYSDL